MNAERDWLKHFNKTQPPEIDLSASFMLISRAFTRYVAVYNPARDSVIQIMFYEALEEFEKTEP